MHIYIYLTLESIQEQLWKDTILYILCIAIIQTGPPACNLTLATKHAILYLTKTHGQDVVLLQFTLLYT